MATKKTKKKSKPGRKRGPIGAREGEGLLRFLDALPLRKQFPLALVILLLGICLLYPELAFQDKIFQARDSEAAKSFAAAANRVMVQERIYPLWNPYLFSGMPSYGSLAYNPRVYPLSMLTGFLIRRLHFPPASWLLFHYLLLGMGVFLLLKDRGLGFVPATMAGFFIVWMPNLVAVGANGHGSQACSVAFIPYALLFWDRIFRGKGIASNGCCLAIVLGFQLLRAHIQISFYTYALIALHLLFFGALRLSDALRGRVHCSGTAAGGVLGGLRKAGGWSPLRLALCEVSLLSLVFAAVVGLSLLISSVLYFPVHDYAQHSIRGASGGGGLEYDYATSWSLHPLETLTFIIPHSFGFGKDIYYGFMPFTDYPNYLGLVIAACSLAALFLVKERFVRFLAFVAVVGTLVAFGKHFPILYNPLFRWLPYFNKFRVPVMVLIVQQLAVVGLFAFGFRALIESRTDLGKKIAIRGLTVFAVVFVLAILSQGYWSGNFSRSVAGGIKTARSPSEQLELARLAGSFLRGDLIKFSLLGSAFFGFLFIYHRGMISRVLFVFLVFVISLADLYAVDRFIIHPEKLINSEKLRIVRDKSAADEYIQPDPVVSFLKGEEGYFRIFPIFHPAAPFYGDFMSNRYMNFAISSIGGYHAAKLAIYNDLLKALSSTLQAGHYQILNMLNVRYLVAGYPLPEKSPFRLRWQGSNWRGEKRYIYENPGALPRAFFVDQYRVSKGKESLSTLEKADVDVSRVVLLEKEPPIRPVTREGSRAEITKYSFNEIWIDAEVASPCILVLSEVFYPRWRVKVDGKEAEILRANYALRAVALPAGDHSLVFAYDASLVKSGLLLSLAAFGSAVIILVFSIVNIRRRRKWKRSL